MAFGGSEGRGQQGIRFLLAAVLAWGLIIADQRLPFATGEVRAALSDWLVKPVRFAARLPEQVWSASSNYFKSREELLATVRDLEEELLRERSNSQSLLHSENENTELREMLGIRRQIQPDAIVAEVVNTSSLPFINRIVLSKGQNQGIQENQGIFNGAGVIGQLTRVDADTSQARLLTDKRFWVATRVRRNGLLVILQGDGGRRMRARLVPADADLRKGDVLVTSGGDGPFPAGLQVALVEITWHASGEPFMEAQATPVASVRQDSALLVHNIFGDGAENPLPLPPSDLGAVPARSLPDVLP